MTAPLRAVFVALAALFAVLLVTRGYWQEPMLGILGLAPEDGRYLGYVEGETSLIAAPVAGQLLERPVNRGQRVKKGDRLFVIDPMLARAEVTRVQALLAESKARHENLLTGKRPEEQDVVRAQRREVEASLELAEAELKRQDELLARRVSTQQAHDQALSQVLQLRARLASLAAQERAGDLAARQAEIAAAAALVEQNEANLAQAKKRLSDLMPAAPEDALVENTFFNVGEWVPAGTPVVSLLPPSRVKLRFFVPEEEVSKARMGREVSFTCDGCPADLRASVIYVSPRAEFTPPVIYSQSSRTKLVFMIEARPHDLPAEIALAPGLPVTVAPFVEAGS
ncbi:MAG: HlyD family efflux transporter periplasmic adaptor subunit [Alphaproteobacteria bacterium]|nr:HlyD family efflux transporter periplasmic adaptor subunit [Alphaproteobacteria bacterium]MBV8412115.1 HlyD family efflux transporter periplasmic adaptor subunit [Alphaproteobacteria bacterium]